MSKLISIPMASADVLGLRGGSLLVLGGLGGKVRGIAARTSRAGQACLDIDIGDGASTTLIVRIVCKGLDRRCPLGVKSLSGFEAPLPRMCSLSTFWVDIGRPEYTFVPIGGRRALSSCLLFVPRLLAIFLKDLYDLRASWKGFRSAGTATLLKISEKQDLTNPNRDLHNSVTV
jgi:hypothetical protein